MSDEAFRIEIREWLSAHLTDELRGAGGVGRENEAFEARLGFARRLAAAGWTTLAWPVAHGGRGASLSQQVIYHEEYARAGAPSRPDHIGTTMVGLTLMDHGTRDRLSGLHPGRVWAVPADVTDESAVQRLISGAVSRYGRLDVLVNNAGLGGYRPVTEMTDAEWDLVLDVTLTGTFRCTRAALQQMIAQGGGGAIVNNASVLGWRAQAGQAHYAAAKAGVMAFTRCAALDVAEHGIRINAVAPSLAAHPFLNRVMSQADLDLLAAREAFGRAAEPWEVATVVAFLASDYASYLTGEVIAVCSQHA